MGDFINITVFHGATNISSKVLSYHRTQEICSGISTLELILDDTGYAIDLWDIITITEEGNKKGEFYVSGNERNVKGGTRRITAQDGSKLLVDYFISDSYTIDYESYTGYWIDKFLTEAGISHGAVATGVVLSSNTQLGLSSAYDTIQTLLQYSNWYLFFDADNVATIGSMTVHSGNPTKLTEASIRAITTNKNDSMLRNRAVVWGNYDTTASGYIFADNSVNTPWNYDSADMRAVVISNSAIATQTDADELSRKLLTEFSKINYEKTIEVIGEVNVTVGNFVNVKSKHWSGSGLVTTVDVTFSSGGLITNLILDQRCPRLFAYWGVLDDYVYVGTTGAGVWRKPIGASDWENFSSGIPSGELSITDLYINKQVFGTITDSGNLYYKQYDEEWGLYTPSGIVDETSTPVSGLFAKGLTINHQTNNIIVGYNNELTVDDARAWVLEITPSGEMVRNDLVYIASGDYRTQIHDLDTNDVDNVISVISPFVVVATDDLGYRTNLPDTLQTSSITYLPTPASGIIAYEPVDYVIGAVGVNQYLEHSSIIPSTVITQNEGPDDIYAYYLYPKKLTAYTTEILASRVKFNLSGWTITTSATEVNLGNVGGGFLYKVSGDNNNLYFLRGYISGGNVYLSDNLIYKINFGTGLATTTVRSAITAGYIYSEQFDNFIYFVYRNITGTDNYTITYSYEKLNILDGSVVSVNMGNTTMTGYRNNYHTTITKCYKAKFTGGGIIFMEWYLTGNNTTHQKEFGLIYGTDGSISKHVEWTNPGSHIFYSYSGILYQRAISGFIGNTTTFTNISTQIRCSTSLGGVVQKFLSGYVHLDDTLSPTITMYDLDYGSCDLPPMEYVDYRLACSTRQLSVPYFISGFGGEEITIRKGIDGTTHTVVTAASLGYDKILASWVETGTGVGIGAGSTFWANTMDDIDDSIYLLAKKVGSSSVHVIGIDYAGNLIKEVDISPYSPYGNTYFYKIYSGTSNSMLYSIRIVADRNGHYTYDLYVGLVLAKNPYYIRGTGSGYQILRQQQDVFTPILTLDALYQVEISKPSPIEVYNITTSGIKDIYQADTASGLFSTITPTYDTYEGRVFDIQSPSTFVVESGVIDGGLRYFGIISDEYLKAFPTTLSGDSITIETFSGGFDHLEMTNNTINPYIFVSANNSPVEFLEREPTASGFVDYSLGLPSGVDLTCIRVDDLL